ncbi:alpha/beta fold hydrolase [Acidobacteriota bacterium]
MTSQARSPNSREMEDKYDFEEKGNGPPVILLHGLFGTLSNWEHTLDFFSDKYRVISLQFPLYAKTFHTIETLTDYLAGFVEFLGLERLAIFGNSLGGHVALNYTLRESDKVACLVLAGSGGLFERGFDKNLKIHPDRKYLKQKIQEVFYDPTYATEEQIREVEWVISTTRRKLSLVKIAKSARGYNMHDLLPQIKCPVCLVWGKEDKITPLNTAQTFKERLANAHLVYISECGHAPIIERPEEFNRHALAFLESLPYP